LEWLLVIVKRAREGDHITTLYCYWNALEKMSSFKWFLCNDGDASADVFNVINSLLVPRTCCFNGNWHEDVCRREVHIFVSLWVCRIVGGWPCLFGGGVLCMSLQRCLAWLKVKGLVLLLMGNPSQSYRASLAIMGSHSVTCHPTQVNTPRHNPRQPGRRGRYSIYLPRRDGRLSWPR